MDNANGSDKNASNLHSGTPPLAQSPVAGAMHAALSSSVDPAGSTAPMSPGAPHRPATNAPYHVHGSVLEGGDSPAVLAQPAAAAAQGQGSLFHPDPHDAVRMHRGKRAKKAIAGAQDAIATRYRVVTETTDDYVHDNPWKSIALGAIGGFIVGMLVSR